MGMEESREKKPVNYRETKLTRLLADSLGAAPVALESGSRAVFLVCACAITIPSCLTDAVGALRLAAALRCAACPLPGRTPTCGPRRLDAPGRAAAPQEVLYVGSAAAGLASRGSRGGYGGGSGGGGGDGGDRNATDSEVDWINWVETGGRARGARPVRPARI